MSPGDPLPFERGAFTRRRLLELGAGALGAASILAACGGDDEAAAPDTTAAGTGAQGTTEAAAGTPKRGGTIKLAFSDAVSYDSLDPGVTSSIFQNTSNGLIYDNLVTHDADWNIQPVLAETYDVNADATEYSFKLRQGVTFHSGKTLSSADVAAVLKRVLDPDSGAGGTSLFEPVLDPSGIETPDPTTIRFKLKAPDGFFLLRLANRVARVYEEGYDFKTLEGSPGTGAFKVQSYKAGEGFEFVRNENYWQEGLPYLDAVNGIVITEAATKAQAVLSGDVDLIDPPEFEAVPQFESSDAVHVYKSPYGAMFTFGIDGTAEPYTDVRVRQALKMLIDREKYVETVCFGQATIGADVPLNPADPLYPADLEPFPYDPEQAKALLAEAGYPEGFEETLWTSGCCTAMRPSTVLLQQSLAEGGIKADVRSTSYDDWGTKRWMTERFVANYIGRRHLYEVCSLIIQGGGAWNEARFADPKVDAWIQEFQQTTDAALQKELAASILTTYGTEAASIWPFHFVDYWPAKTRLQGVMLHTVDKANFTQAYVET
jgi:peptide/nickel transport system substrate-binding protein